MLLHPIDARHQQALDSGIQFENPVGHPILGEFGFEALLFRGQTAGSIVLYATKHGGVFLLVIQLLAPVPIRQKPVWSVWLGHQLRQAWTMPSYGNNGWLLIDQSQQCYRFMEQGILIDRQMTLFQSCVLWCVRNRHIGMR